MSKYHEPNKVWHVSYNEATLDFRCSCECMESFRIPCVYIINVVVYVDMEKLPSYLILYRQTMKVKEVVTMMFRK